MAVTRVYTCDKCKRILNVDEVFTWLTVRRSVGNEMEQLLLLCDKDLKRLNDWLQNE